MNYFNGNTFGVRMEVGKVLELKVNGVGVGGSGPWVELLCSFLL